VSFIVLELIDAMPPPEHCDVCCSVNIALTDNCYFCFDCRASVGCHPGTTIPLGRMGNRLTRTLRSRAHAEFDKLWFDGLLTRSKAYDWLAKQLEIEPNQCHMSWLTDDQLRDVATLSSDYYRTHYDILLRRKAKRNDKARKQRNQNRERYTDADSTRDHIRKRAKKHRYNNRSRGAGRS
jgi:hypothetical protein